MAEESGFEGLLACLGGAHGAEPQLLAAELCVAALAQESCAADTTVWEDSELTTALWQLVYDNNLEGLFEVLEEHPSLAHKRSSDGRGLLWWAYEYERHEMVQLLLARGVDQYAQDKFGKRPIQLKNKLAAECRLGEHNIKCPG